MKTNRLLLSLLFAFVILLSTNQVSANDSSLLDGVYNFFSRVGTHIEKRMKPNVRVENPQGIQVIGAGYGRTGTKTLKQALNMLGYKAYHMDQVQSNNHGEVITKAFHGDEKAAEEWFRDIASLGYLSTTDVPTSLFYKEQMKLYPDAKVILTTRDGDRWFKSWHTLMSTAANFRARPFRWFINLHEGMSLSFGLPNGTNSIPECTPKADEDFEFYEPWYLPWVKIPVNVKINKEKCIARYNAHVAEVYKVVPKNKLLAMKISEGWEPICRFLGIPVPSEPFPSVNSSEEIAGVATVAKFLGYTYPFLLILVLYILYFILKKVSSLFSSSKERKIKTN